MKSQFRHYVAQVFCPVFLLVITASFLHSTSAAAQGGCVITCPGDQVLPANAMCQATLPSYISNPSLVLSGNCPGYTLTQSPLPGTIVSGPNTVYLTARDNSGNEVSCFFVVRVSDVTQPTITCPANIMQGTNETQCGAYVSFPNATATDNCSPGAVVLQIGGPVSGGLFLAGTTTVTFKAIDAANNSSTCTTTITISDQTPPFMICPGNVTLNNSVDECGTYSPFSTYSSAAAYDNCSGYLTSTQISGPQLNSFLPVGTTSTIVVQATDISNNSASCSFTVKVVDNQKPTITCPPNKEVVITSGCSANVSFPSATATDNCTPPPTITQIEGPASGDDFPIVPSVSGGDGYTIVKFRATDAANNVSDCTFYVKVVEREYPVITCQPNIIQGNAPGQCGANVMYAKATATDNCTLFAPLAGNGPPSGAFFGLGTTTIRFWAIDASSNSSSCDLTITVNDTEAPVVTCPANITANNNPAEACSAVVYHSLPNPSDNCGVTSTSLASGLIGGSTFPVGITTNIWRTTDMNGNSSTCSFTVLVKDITLPVITCPANITANNNPAEACGAVVHHSLPNPTDNCGITSIILTSGLIGGSTFPVGITTNVWRATDVNGNSSSCSFTIFVKDIVVPAITCPANIVQANTTGQCGTTVTFNSATASDNCTVSPAITNLGPASGSFFAVGTTSVTFRATDASNNSATCSFTVTVNDTQAPAITCPANITANNNPTETCSAVVQYGAPAATDNCGVGSVALASGLSGGSTFPVGITTNSWRAIDINGNSASCSFTVLVKDITLPAITCPANQTILAGSSCTGTLGSWTPVSMTDNCNPAPFFVQAPVASTLLSGHNDSKVVTLTAIDASNNKSVCTFTVTLKDVTAPVAKCKNATINLGANGSVTVASSAVNNGSTDNCSLTTTLTPNTFGCAQVGNQLVTLKATDSGGNTGACTAILTIKDLTAPTASCKNINVYLDDTGHAGITPASVNNNSYDACGIASMIINNNEFDCSQINGSPVLVQLTLKDVNNNQSSCQAQVYVKDNIPPTAVCSSTTVWLSASGYASVQTAPLVDNSFDNCSVTSYTPVAKVYNTSNLGVNNLTITVKDWSNNSASCVAQVTVLPFNGNLMAPDGRAEKELPYDPEMLFDLGMSVFPNPTSGESTITFQLPEVQTCHLRLFDLNGRLIIDQSIQGTAGDNSFGLDLNELAPGMYLIEVGAAGMRGQKKLAVQRD